MGKNMRIAVAFLFLSAFCVPATAQDLSRAVDVGINSIRAAHGLRPLARERRLDSAAESQARWMCSVGRMDHMREPPRSFDEFKTCDHHPANRVVNSGYFTFDELFSLRYNDTGVEVIPKDAANSNVSEIIAAGFGGGPQVRRPDIILDGWMRSPGHRKAILTPHFNEFGVAVSSSNGVDVYWCVVFAAR